MAGLAGPAFSFASIAVLPVETVDFALRHGFMQRGALERTDVFAPGFSAPVFLCATTITAWLRWKKHRRVHFFVAESIRKV
ncbi:hypothetical protein AVM02_00025 [Brucella anthropi]